MATEVLTSGARHRRGKARWVVLVGAIIVAGIPGQPTWLRVVTLTAVALGTANVVGGFVVTDRMLEMFKPKKKREAAAEEEAKAE